MCSWVSSSALIRLIEIRARVSGPSRTTSLMYISDSDSGLASSLTHSSLRPHSPTQLGVSRYVSRYPGVTPATGAICAGTVAVPQSYSSQPKVGVELRVYRQTPRSCMVCLGNPQTQGRPHRWIPPPHLDSGQSRVNDYHHPENYLLPNEGGEPTDD